MLTLAEAKLQLNVTDNTHDDELQDYIDAVTAVVERQTGEVVDPRTVEEVHEARSQSQLMLRSMPVTSLISVEAVDDTQAWDVADIYIDESTGELTVLSGPLFDGQVKVTLEVGYDVVPPNYNLAARIILQHLWKTQRGVASAPFAGGTATALGEGGVGFAIPRRASELLGSFMPGVA